MVSENQHITSHKTYQAKCTDGVRSLLNFEHSSERSTMSKESMARRCITPRKVILLGCLIAVGRLSWSGFRALFSPKHERYLAGFPDGEFDINLPPKGCIMTANKSCIPENSDDVYLGKGLYAHGDSFYMDGRPFKIFGGSFHYFRTQPADWGDRLMKMKAAGLNTVTTYIPWNLHEPVKDHYVFGGRWDIAGFIKQAQQVGLKVIIRAGPYICAEWEFGGLPSWLLRDSNLKVRTSDRKFLRYVEEYFSKLLPIFVPLTYKKGGPIIAFQIENEYGSYAGDKVYLKFLLAQHKKYGIEELFFTSDGTRPEQLANGTLPGVLVTVNFKEKQKEHLDELKKAQPDKPLMVTEFWPGWFDHWSEEHHGMENDVFEKFVTAILEYGASVNFYMFVGGTNFGFMNGANKQRDGPNYEPTITSYDYDAPISEDGSLKEKFFIAKKLLSKYAINPEEPMKVVDEIKRGGYGVVQILKWMPYRSLTDIAEDAAISKVGQAMSSDLPLAMEDLKITNGCGQNYGFLLYRAQINTDKAHTVEVLGRIHDRAQLILNNEELTTYYRNDISYTRTTLPIRPALEHGSSNLDFLVENMGRINYLRGTSLESERRGLLGTLKMDGSPLTSWRHIPMDFDEEFVDVISQKDIWLQYTIAEERAKTGEVISGPAMYKAELNIDSMPVDTYLDMYGWTKGIVFINGYNIGRYWRVGPQRTLYVPASLLNQGKNIIMVFELHKPSNNLKFAEKPMLHDRW